MFPPPPYWSSTINIICSQKSSQTNQKLLDVGVVSKSNTFVYGFLKYLIGITQQTLSKN